MKYKGYLLAGAALFSISVYFLVMALLIIIYMTPEDNPHYFIYFWGNFAGFGFMLFFGVFLVILGVYEWRKTHK